MKPIVQLSCLLAVLLSLASCGLPDIRIKRLVDPSEIVGTWELDPGSSALAADNSIDRYVADPTKPHEITFKEDGTCQYRSVFQMPTRFVEASGEWELGSTEGDPRGSEIDLSLQIEGEGTHSFSLDLREEAGELILWEFWGDPDSWRFLEYRRR